MGKWYAMTMAVLPLSFLLVTSIPYGWIFSDFLVTGRLSADIGFTPLLIVVGGWLVCGAIPVIMLRAVAKVRSTTVGDDSTASWKLAHLRFLVTLFVRHFVVGFALVATTSLLFVLSIGDDWMFFGVSLTVTMLFSGYMVAYDVVLLQRLQMSRHHARSGQLPERQVALLPLLRSPLMVLPLVLLAIHLLLPGYGAIYGACLVVLIVASYWVWTGFLMIRPTQSARKETTNNRQFT